MAKLWSRINPAVRKRYLAAAGIAAIALIGFVVSNQIGEQAGMAAISVSEEDQAAANAHYEQAVAIVASNPGEARTALVEALRMNPYLEDAAEMLVAEIGRVQPNKPQQFTLAWSDFVTAYAAAPTSEALTAFADQMTEEYSQRDISTMSRLRVLSELRVPVCALSSSGHGAETLAPVIESASISC